jgi:hypothetical protein
MNENTLVYIWSNEHKAWWNWGNCGYRKDKRDAGQYRLEDALKICVGANRYQKSNDVPNESIVPINP